MNLVTQTDKDSFAMDEYEKSVRKCVLSNLELMLSSPFIILYIPVFFVLPRGEELAQGIFLIWTVMMLIIELPIIINFLVKHIKHIIILKTYKHILDFKEHDRFKEVSIWHRNTSLIAWIAPVIGIIAGCIISVLIYRMF